MGRRGGTCLVKRLRDADLDVNIAALMIFCSLATVVLGTFGGIGPGMRQAHLPSAPPNRVVEVAQPHPCAVAAPTGCGRRNIPVA